MTSNRLELRLHGRVLLIAPHAEFGISFIRSEFRNNFISAAVEAEWKIRSFVLSNIENAWRLQSFWERQASFCFTSPRLDIIIPDIARRFAVLEIADERATRAAPYQERVEIGDLNQPISSMGFTEKVALVFQRMPQYLPEAARSEVAGLITPMTIGVTVGSVVAVIVGGPIVQGILLAVGFAVVGWSIFRAIGDILDFIDETRNATTQADIDSAARKLAAAASALGIGAVIGFLSRGAGRIAAQRGRTSANTQSQNQQHSPHADDISVRSINTLNTTLTTHVPTSGRKFNQLTSRGWNQSSIDDIVNNPVHTSSATNRATGNPATAYFDNTGNYVVRDNVTGRLVQMSNRNDPDWIPDPSIDNPYNPR